MGQLCMGCRSEVSREATSSPRVILGDILSLQRPRQLVLMRLQRCRLDSTVLKFFSNLKDFMVPNDFMPTWVAILQWASSCSSKFIMARNIFLSPTVWAR